MAIISECTVALKCLYDWPSWTPCEGRSRLARRLRDASNLQEKVELVLDRLEEHADYWVCPTREGHFTTEQKNIFWASMMDSMETEGYRRVIIEAHSGKQFNNLLCDKIQRTLYVNRDIIKMLRLIWKRRIMFYNAEPNHNYESLSAADQEISVKLITDAIDIYNRNIASMPTYHRLLANGSWGRTLNPRWVRLGYFDHRRAQVKPTTDSTTNWKYGIELEGRFRTVNDMQACIDELSKTPYDGGHLLDERNWVLPTSDGSLNSETGCEFVFAPFEYDKGIEFCTKVEEVLKRHNFIRSTEAANAGIHCHADAKAFKHTNNLWKLHNYVYKMPDNEKFDIYKRPSGQFCNWRETSTANIQKQWIQMTGQFTKEGKQLGYLDQIFVIDKCNRYSLVNYEHVKVNSGTSLNEVGEIRGGTVEFRGWNASVPIAEVFKTVKRFYESAAL